MSVRHTFSIVSTVFTVILFTTCGTDTDVIINDLETQVKEILELPTYEHVYRDIIYVGEEETFLMFTTVDKRVLFSIDVVVQAGIDFTEGLELIPGKEKSITVRLPPAKILLIDADENSIHQYFVRERGGSVSRLDYYDEIDRQKETIRNDALERGILYKAEQTALKLIAQFLQMAGFTDITFQTLIQSEDNTRSPSGSEPSDTGGGNGAS